jgi:uncharacterized protein
MAAPRVVLDTNVVLDLLHFADPRVLPLGEVLARGALVACADARTLAELSRVVAYPSFGLDAAGQQALLARYGAQVQLVPEGPAPALPRCADREDQMFLELAARAGAAWLVSKDKQLLQLDGWSSLSFLILTPGRAVQRLAETAVAG